MATVPPGYSTVGLKVHRGNGADPEQFQEIPQCIQIPMIGEPSPLIDTSYSSNKRRTRIAGRSDSEEMEWRFNYIKGDPVQEAIIDNYTSGTKKNENWRCTVPNATEQVWGWESAYAYVGVELGLDAQQILVVRVQPSGGIDWDSSL